MNDFIALPQFTSFIKHFKIKFFIQVDQIQWQVPILQAVELEPMLAFKLTTL